MKFKHGDKIRRINEDYDDVRVGQIYTFNRYSNENDASECTMIIEYPLGKYVSTNFELVRQPVKNDIEWLDRIQLNFKEE